MNDAFTLADLQKAKAILGAVPSLSGIQIIESPYLVQPGEPYEQNRTWRERLFSRPWQPLRKTTTITPMVPMKGAVRLAGGQLAMHPVAARALRDSLSEHPNSNPNERSFTWQSLAV